MSDHLARLCLGGDGPSSGWYTPHTYSLLLRGEVQPTDHLVYLHEVHHAALNDVTAWGTALHVYARLPADAGQQFDQLLDACRVTHESLATFASAEIARARHSDAEVERSLAAYPDYLPLYEATVTLAAGVRGVGRRQLIVTALARLCMQSPVLEAVMDLGPEAFRLAAIRDRDRPDGRWHWFLRQGPKLLARAASAADQALTAEFGRAALESDGTDGDLYQSTDRAHDEAWDFWELSAYEELRVALEATGARTLTLTGHQALTAEVLTVVHARYPDVGLRAAMTDEQQRSDAAVASSVLQQVRHEFNGGERYRALLIPPMENADVVDALADRPVIDGRPAMIVDARPASRLAALYRWPEDGFPTARRSPVVALRMIVDDGGTDVAVGHLVMDEPSVLATLAEAWRGHGPLVVCVSASCLADADWAQRWIPILDPLGSLFFLVDVEPERFVPAWAAAGREVVAIGMEINDTGGHRTALFFTPDGGVRWWMVTADGVTVRLMTEYLREELGAGLSSDVRRFSEIRDAARIVVSHLLATESFVSFDGVGGSDAG